MRDFDLRALQLRELQLLKDLTDFCDAHGIVYFLEAGTLLGAVRHKGFIPWDDDVDVCMDVKNYRKLLRAAKEFSAPYFFQNYRTEPTFDAAWSKLRLDGTTCMPREFTALNSHFGVGMDIFVMSGLARTKPGRAIQRWASNMLHTLLKKDKMRVAGWPMTPRMRRFFAVVPDGLRLLLARIAERLSLRDTQASDVCFNVYYDLTRSDIAWIPSACYREEDRIALPFESEVFYAPRRYEDVLTAYYGDSWRELPPEEDREDHGDMIVDLETDWRTYYTGE